MKSDKILIDNRGNGFEKAVQESGKVARYNGLGEKEALYLQICTEEILSLARSVTGEMMASFWLENEGNQYSLHLSTKTVMNKEKRASLLSAATSRKNEAARTFLGRIRNAFEEAMTADVNREGIPDEVLYDLPSHPIEETEWDGLERSILKKVSD